MIEEIKRDIENNGSSLMAIITLVTARGRVGSARLTDLSVRRHSSEQSDFFRSYSLSSARAARADKKMSTATSFTR